MASPSLQRLGAALYRPPPTENAGASTTATSPAASRIASRSAIAGPMRATSSARTGEDGLHLREGRAARPQCRDAQRAATGCRILGGTFRPYNAIGVNYAPRVCRPRIATLLPLAPDLGREHDIKLSKLVLSPPSRQRDDVNWSVTLVDADLGPLRFWRPPAKSEGSPVGSFPQTSAE